MNLKEEIFGKSQSEIWKKLADELNGKFYHGAYGIPAKVEIKYKNWIITLDTNIWTSVGRRPIVATKTRMTAAFFNKDEFTFQIVTKNLLSTISKFFGAQDITIGDPDFDNKFIIKGDNVDKVQLLFSSRKIRKLLLKLNNLYFEIRTESEIYSKEMPKDKNELFFYIDDIVIDINQLKMMFDLFKEALDQLCLIDIANEN